MEVDIVLCYEIWQRELQALMALRCRLEKRGYRVKILHIHPAVDRFLEAYLYEPKVIYYPWVYSNLELRKARDFKGNCKKIINAQCEQILGKRVDNSGVFRIKGEAKKVYHVSWGEKTYQRYIDWGIKENHILKVGNINLEINKEKYDKFYLDRSQIANQFHLDKDKKWVMFCSNFKFAESRYYELIGVEKRSPGIINLAKESKKAKRSILQWMIQYLSEHDNVEIIYRAHPCEKHDKKLEHLQRKVKSFHYISDYSINQWSRVVDIFSTWGSTSIIDAIYRNKKSAYLTPGGIPEIIKGDADHICPHICDYKTFSSFLNEEQNTSEMSISNLIYSKDDSIEELANYIEHIYHLKTNIQIDSKLTNYTEWKNVKLSDKIELFMYWLAKRVKLYKLFIKRGKLHNLYYEAYENRMIENNIYKKMKEITDVQS